MKTFLPRPKNCDPGNHMELRRDQHKLQKHIISCEYKFLFVAIFHLTPFKDFCPKQTTARGRSGAKMIKASSTICNVLDDYPSSRENKVNFGVRNIQNDR